VNVETIRTQLKSLRLATASRDIDDILGKHKKAVNLEWVAELLERELDGRKENALRARIKQAGFPELTTLENFDWSFNAKINEAKLRELADLHFLEGNEIALFLGPPGVGKTHCALAIGHLATRAGHRVFWTSAKRLSRQIIAAKARDSLDQFFKRILAAKLWIIDDWGVITMDRDVAEEVFDLLDRRKYSSALILTSNRAVSEWGQVFPDVVLANSTVDRMFEHAHYVAFEGESYRLKGRIKTRDVDMDKEAT
jgi:DNA replication protein DnaC